MWSSLVIGRVWVLNMFLFCIIYSLGNYTGTNTIKMEHWKIENNVLSLSLAGPAISFPLLQLNFRSENDYENIECATQRSIQLLLVLERRSGCACPYKNVLLASKRHLCLDSSVKYSCGTWDDAFCSLAVDFWSKLEFRAFIRIRCRNELIVLTSKQQHTALHDNALRRVKRISHCTAHDAMQHCRSTLILFVWMRQQIRRSNVCMNLLPSSSHPHT